MKQFFAALLLVLAGLMSPAIAQTPSDWDDFSNAELVEQAPDLHPAALYLLANRLIAAGEVQEAANWMYLAQLRYRFLLEATPDQDEGTLFSVLFETVGRPVNEAIGADIDDWIASMQWALDWDAANDNGTTPKTEHAEALADIRGGLEDLIEQVDGSRDDIRVQREANGLPNN